MDKVFRFLKKDGTPWIFASLLTFNCLPQILCAFFMLVSNNYLSNGFITFLNIISFLISYLLFIIGLLKLLDEKISIGKFIYGLPVILCYSIILIFSMIIDNFGWGNYLWFSIIQIIINSFILIVGVAASISFVRLKKYEVAVKPLIKLGLIGILIYVVPTIIYSLLGLILAGNIFVVTLLMNFIYSLLIASGFVFAISYIDKNLNIEIKEKVPHLIISGICAGLLIIYVIFNIVFNNYNKVKSYDNYMSYSLAAGDYAFDNGDILVSKSFYEEANEFKCAWEYELDPEHKNNSCNGTLYELFKTLNSETAIADLKKRVNDKTATNYDLEALMYLMQKENDKDIGKITRFLISQMNFTRTTVLPFDLSDKDKEIVKEKLSKYDKNLLVRKYVEVYYEWLNQGEINTSVIAKATSLAREYPEELSLQKVAINFYLNSPNGLHGDSNVVDNFVKLTEESIKNESNERILTYKTYVAAAYYSCDANDKAISFLERTKPELINDYTGNILLLSYKEKRNHDKAAEVALKVLKTNKDHVNALAYLSVYYLSRDLDKSVKYAVDLSNVIKDKKEDYLTADKALGVYTQYLFGYYESPDSVLCAYHNYARDLTDEQKKLISDNEILNTYVNGKNLSDEANKLITSTLEKYDYISHLYYLRGMYEVNNKQYDKAIEDLLKAIELGNNNPFIYSELGFAYEGAGDLKKSLDAFERADKLVDELGLSLVYNYNSIHSYFAVYINNAKHAMYESEGDH